MYSYMKAIHFGGYAVIIRSENSNFGIAIYFDNIILLKFGALN